MHLIRCQIHSHVAHQLRFTKSLEADIQTAYEEQEAVETAASAYGKPIDRDAIAKSLTLRSLIAQKDRHLAAYLGISIDTRKADAEIEAAKMRAERLRLETQRLREKNQAVAQERQHRQSLAPWQRGYRSF